MSSQDKLDQLNDEFNRKIDEAHALYAEKFTRNLDTIEGGVYARQSTKDQNSIANQVREILDEALRKNIFARREHIFFDTGVTGRSSRRKGARSTGRADEEPPDQLRISRH
jgi:hypothetical protein